ncbi:MAG: hypothetical protein IPO93_16135 [Actinobacteria bacterium]|jgi:hypothetical protein|nr:hypothetical protein [Actinomycetota bacterium]
MPLFFAIATVVSLLLALLVLGAPVLLVVLVFSAVRSSRPRPPLQSDTDERQVLEAMPISDDGSPDLAFAELVSRNWPGETRHVRHPE